jgi:protein-tyrosine phosphatase
MGNICRSPLAHGVFDHFAKEAGLKAVTESSGTSAWHAGELPDARMRAEALTHGISLKHRARAFTPSDLDEYDLILAMDRSNYQDVLLHARNEEQKKKVKMFRDFDPVGTGGDVPDPYYGEGQGFRDVYAMTERTIRNLIDKITGDSR